MTGSKGSDLTLMHAASVHYTRNSSLMQTLEKLKLFAKASDTG